MKIADNPSTSVEEIPSDSAENINPTLFNWSQLWQSITRISDKQQTYNKSPMMILGNEFESTDEFELDIYSKICLTYRFGFEPILKSVDGPSPLSFVQSLIFNKNLFLNNFQHLPSLIDADNFTNDVGWGCMIRTSQSLLANTYLQLILGKDFKFDKDQDNSQHKCIIDLFMDNSDSPLSLHNFIKVASESPLKVKPGEWFGPNAASLSIKRLCAKLYDLEGMDIPKAKVLISESCDLYDNKINEIFHHKGLDGLLILLPVRLGIDKINSFYHTSLLHLLSLKQSVGIAGGKPSSSFYFLGYQDDDLIYLDPHCPQQCMSKTDYESYHTLNYQKLNINDLDPSMMIGILLHNLNDYDDFKKNCRTNSNKIVHFHALERKGSINESQRKSSDSINMYSNEEPNGDEFINIRYDKREIDDFIDLGDEYNELNEDTNRTIRSKYEQDILNDSDQGIVPKDSIFKELDEPNDSKEDIVKISTSISENYENIDHPPTSNDNSQLI